jgi:hypothetical protein
MMHELWTLESRRGFPGTLIRLGDSLGSLLFLELRTEPVVQVAALTRDDAAELVAVLGEWLRDGLPSPAPAAAPLVAGAVSRGLADARTVQFRTVRGADQHEPPEVPAAAGCDV